MTTEKTLKRTMTPTFLMEAPLFRTLLFHPMLAWLFVPIGNAVMFVRRMLAPPFRVRLLPHWLGRFKTNAVLAPILRMLDWTVGQLLLVAPLAVAFLLCLHYTVGSDDTLKSVPESGKLTMVGMAYVFLTASKSNSILAVAFGVPADRLVAIHRLAALVTIAMAVCHLSVAYELRSTMVVPAAAPADTSTSSDQQEATEVKQALGEFLLQRDAVNTSGAVVVLFIIILIATSYFTAALRTYAYQTWYTLHMLLPAGILIGLGIHDRVGGLLAFLVAWWGMDLIFRYALPRYRGNTCVNATLRPMGMRGASQRPHEPAIEITMQAFDFLPGQHVKICVPAISLFEYHAVSISSAPHDPLTVHFRARGDWTRKLLKLAQSRQTTTVWLEGPYGALSFDAGHKVFVLVSGGIGVTPCRSLARYLLQRQQRDGDAFRSIKFVWAVRSTKMVRDLPPLEPNEDDVAAKSLASDRSSGSHDDVVPEQAGGHRSSQVQSQTITQRNKGTCDNKSGGECAAKLGKANVDVDIYCTRLKQDASSHFLTPDMAQNGHTLRSHRSRRFYDMTTTVYHARPDLDAILQQAQKEAVEVHGENRIAVLGCGPPSLMKDLEASCHAHGASTLGGTNSVFIDLHIESFDM